MKYKIIFMMLVLFLALPMIVADNPTYQRNTSVDLKVPCYNNGTTCSTIATCNATIINPLGTLVVNNKNMTRNDSTFNYTLIYNKTTELGEYQFPVTCCDGVDCAVNNLLFDVTNSGVTVNEAEAETITRGTYVLLVISILFFVGFYFLREGSVPFKWTFFLLGIFFITITINIVSLSIHNYSLETDVFNVFDMFSAISYYMVWFVGGLLLMIWILTLIASMKDYFQNKKNKGIGNED